MPEVTVFLLNFFGSQITIDIVCPPSMKPCGGDIDMETSDDELLDLLTCHRPDSWLHPLSINIWWIQFKHLMFNVCRVYLFKESCGDVHIHAVWKVQWG